MTKNVTHDSTVNPFNPGANFLHQVKKRPSPTTLGDQGSTVSHLPLSTNLPKNGKITPSTPELPKATPSMQHLTVIDREILKIYNLVQDFVSKDLHKMIKEKPKLIKKRKELQKKLDAFRKLWEEQEGKSITWEKRGKLLSCLLSITLTLKGIGQCTSLGGSIKGIIHLLLGAYSLSSHAKGLAEGLGDSRIKDLLTTSLDSKYGTAIAVALPTLSLALLYFGGAPLAATFSMETLSLMDFLFNMWGTALHWGIESKKNQSQQDLKETDSHTIEIQDKLDKNTEALKKGLKNPLNTFCNKLAKAISKTHEEQHKMITRILSQTKA